MNTKKFKEKFIGFVDILGFKDMIKFAENGTGMSLDEIYEAVKLLGTSENQANYAKYGPTTCPGAPRNQRDMDFRVSQISDCAIVSAEVSPAGAINLIHHCWGAAITLLVKGIMCRGYITRGSIYHEGTDFYGTGYQEALDKERNVRAFKQEADERGTPFIEVDQNVCDYIANCEDKCVKEMFGRFVKSDGSVTALFPFQRLSHSFMIGGFLGGIEYKFDPEKEKRSVQLMRNSIHIFKERILKLVDHSNPSAVSKARHYIAALDAQLIACNRTEDMINRLSQPFFPR